MMDDNSGTEEYQQTRKIPLSKGLDLKSLLTGTTFDIDIDALQINEDEKAKEEGEYDPDQFIPCPIDLEDQEDENDERSPFERLASKMTNVTPDGKIKKLIQKEGKGSTPPEDAFVSIRYLSYLEYNDEPTDRTYVNEPFRFQLGQSGIAGLNIAVYGMKLGEKSQFLIHYDYAFGRMGHPPRIPPEATFLFQIELLNFTESASSVDITYLEVKEKSFEEANKIVVGIMENAKRHFKRDCKLSIYEYNRAVAMLEKSILKNMTEEEQQQRLLLKLYTNLAVCYTKVDNPKKACCMCNNIYAMTRNTSLRIPPKVYFQNGRAHLKLGNYEKALSLLLKAQELMPADNIIINEIKLINAKMKEEESKKLNLDILN